MPIISCSSELLVQAEALVKSVFRWMTPVEKISFTLIRHPTSFISRLVRLIAGIKDLITFDAYVDEHGTVLGTIGLYRYKHDSSEAAWVAWFCVHPTARGRGIGQALIEHTIRTALKSGFRKIRLYTSTAPNEAAAQLLYEKNGFAQVRMKRRLFTTIILREKIIADAQ